MLNLFAKAFLKEEDLEKILASVLKKMEEFCGQKGAGTSRQGVYVALVAVLEELLDRGIIRKSVFEAAMKALDRIWGDPFKA